MDQLRVTEDGRLVMTIGDDEFPLRHPKIGEMRRFDERWVAIVSDYNAELAAQAADTAEKIANSNDDDEATDHVEPVWGFRYAVLGWWRDVVGTLNEGDKNLPVEDDDLPYWMLNAKLRDEWRQVVIDRPWVPGGSPEEKTLKLLGGLPQATLQQLAQAAASRPAS